jgi:hypothetical protein
LNFKKPLGFPAKTSVSVALVRKLAQFEHHFNGKQYHQTTPARNSIMQVQTHHKIHTPSVICACFSAFSFQRARARAALDKENLPPARANQANSGALLKMPELEIANDTSSEDESDCNDEQKLFRILYKLKNVGAVSFG